MAVTELALTRIHDTAQSHVLNGNGRALLGSLGTERLLALGSGTLPQPEVHGERTPLQEAMDYWLRPSTNITKPLNIEVVNTELYLGKLSQDYGRRVTVDTIPAPEWAWLGTNRQAIWFGQIGEQSPASLKNSRHWERVERQYSSAGYPDLNPKKHLRGCPYAARDHAPDPKIAPGGSVLERWARFREAVDTAHEHGLMVGVDLIPNHTAKDRRLVRERPDLYIQGTYHDFKSQPWAYFKVRANDGKYYYIAHGWAKGHLPWSDTAQLNWANPDVHTFMLGQAMEMVENMNVDIFRVDMAPLIVNFVETWGHKLRPEQIAWLTETDPNTGEQVHNFFRNSIPVLKEAKRRVARKEAAQRKALGLPVLQDSETANLYFIAEAYNGDDKRKLDSTARGAEDGFDFIYAKDLYDNVQRVLLSPGHHNRITHGNLREHEGWIIDGYRNGLKHYMELAFGKNHDETSLVYLIGPDAAISASMYMMHLPNSGYLEDYEFALEGWQKVPMQVNRFRRELRRNERVQGVIDRNAELRQYKIFQEGEARMAGLSQNSDEIHAFRYESPDVVFDAEASAQPRKLVAIPIFNHSHHVASCRIPEIDIEWEVKVYDLAAGKQVENIDMERPGGMYFELEPFSAQIAYCTPKAA